MAYVDENLLPAERVVYRAHLHPIIYAGPFALALAALALLAFAFWRGDLPAVMWAALLILVIALVLATIQFIHSRSSEFAVTNRRVVIKTGVIRRHTLELLLAKVEGIGVDQTIFGRMLNMGSIVVIGTGGSKEEFAKIANPLEFRHQVQAQTAEFLEPDMPVARAPQNFGGPFCSKCGAQNPSEASFCFKCGTKIVTAP
jgi:uncharacterized membrane protein YdbT with pleckstrin-like domain/ribosomal protein L40E